MPKFLILLLVAFGLIGLSGCSDAKCDQAKAEVQKSESTLEGLNQRKEKLERQIYSEWEYECAGRLDEKPSIDDSISETIRRGLCREWENNNREMTKIMADDSRAQLLNKEIIETGRRWALTITTYKECFEASQVIDATEVLERSK